MGAVDGSWRILVSYLTNRFLLVSSDLPSRANDPRIVFLVDKFNTSGL